MKRQNKADSYIEALPDEARAIASLLRHTLESLVPGIEERFSFGLPFYHYFGMFCYISWVKKENAVELAFCRGKDLMMAFPELEMKQRAMIAGITYTAMPQINQALLHTLILAAADWQVEAKKAGKSFLKKPPRKKK